MPRERRETLLNDLKEYDGLSPTDKSGVRALDETLAKLPLADQTRYYSVLRRYHLWVSSLPEPQQNQLKNAAPEERMKLVAKFRAEERQTTPRRSSPRILQLADFGASTPFEMAHQIGVWQALNPQQRSALEKVTNPADAQQRLRELGKGLNLKAEMKLLKQEEDELASKMEAHLQETKIGAYVGLMKKKDGSPDARKLKRWAENYYFIEHPPQAVRPDNLLRFGASLPHWIRASFDHLPADEARRRLTILYRLLYPPGQEMPITKATVPPKDAAAPKAKPAPAKAPAKKGAANAF
ncbi:MAG: hypothetical protein P4L84_17040 [Isosphaeraceae bacterium]|nr:hypothetical protein [Isosphaeraceae bacterium]